MNQTFASMLAEDGKKNSLGRVNDVIELVLDDKMRLEELYHSIFHDDAWVRMRAIDAFEKICREHPEWIKPYIIRIQDELSGSTQASIKWHIAQNYAQVELTDFQKSNAVSWLKKQVVTTEVDWIVSANCMESLAHFVRNGDANKSDLIAVAQVQLGHKSNAVTKRARKLLSEFSGNMFTNPSRA